MRYLQILAGLKNYFYKKGYIQEGKDFEDLLNEGLEISDEVQNLLVENNGLDQSPLRDRPSVLWSPLPVFWEAMTDEVDISTDNY